MPSDCNKLKLDDEDSKKKAMSLNETLNPIREEFLLKLTDKTITDYELYEIAKKIVPNNISITLAKVRDEKQIFIDYLMIKYLRLCDMEGVIEEIYETTYNDRIFHLEYHNENSSFDEQDDWKIQQLNKFDVVANQLLKNKISEFREYGSQRDVKIWKNWNDFIKDVISTGRIYSKLWVLLPDYLDEI